MEKYEKSKYLRVWGVIVINIYLSTNSFQKMEMLCIMFVVGSL